LKNEQADWMLPHQHVSAAVGEGDQEVPHNENQAVIAR